MNVFMPCSFQIISKSWILYTDEYSVRIDSREFFIKCCLTQLSVKKYI